MRSGRAEERWWSGVALHSFPHRLVYGIAAIDGEGLGAVMKRERAPLLWPLPSLLLRAYNERARKMRGRKEWLIVIG